MNGYRIPQMVNKYASHDMIQSHTDLPLFPEFRTRLLFAFLAKDSSQEANSELFALVTSLMQMGMDTHDMVSNDNEVDSKGLRKKQLQVLAGDYFSAQYYYLLSVAGRIDMVKQLAKAVCEANTLKMNMYLQIGQLKITPEEYIKQLVQIKMALYVAFADHLQGSNAQNWPDILHAFTEAEVIAQELRRLEKPDQYKESWGFWYILKYGQKEDKKQLLTPGTDVTKWNSLMLKYNIEGLLNQLLNKHLYLLVDMIKQVDNDMLRVDLAELCQPFLDMQKSQGHLEIPAK